MGYVRVEWPWSQEWMSEKQFMCPGNCSECAIVGCGCWNAKKGDTILFEAH